MKQYVEYYRKKIQENTKHLSVGELTWAILVALTSSGLLLAMVGMIMFVMWRENPLIILIPTAVSVLVWGGVAWVKGV